MPARDHATHTNDSSAMQRTRSAGTLIRSMETAPAEIEPEAP